MSYPCNAQIESMTNADLLAAFDKKSGQIKTIKYYLDRFQRDLNTEMTEHAAIHSEIMARECEGSWGR